MKEDLNTILITGDIVIDRVIYEGERFSSKQTASRGVKVVNECGGVKYILKLMNALLAVNARLEFSIIKENEIREQKKEKKISFYPISNNWNISPGKIHQFKPHASFSIWKPYPFRNKQEVYRLSQNMGYGDLASNELDDSIFKTSEEYSRIDSKTKILVLDDAGFDFRLKVNEDNWNLNDGLDWIIVKLSRPFASGDLWAKLISDYSEKMIVIISANEIRKEDIRISERTSWEQIVEDTKVALLHHHKAKELMKAKHLIVTYNNDGALLIENTGSGEPEVVLLCDTARIENEWSEKIEGKAFGYMSCVVSAVIYYMINNGKSFDKTVLVSGVEAGLSAMRNLLEFGHGFVEQAENKNGFPATRIAEEIIKPTHKYSSISLPWKLIGTNKKIMIAEIIQRSSGVETEMPLTGLATLVVKYGSRILSNIPHAQFNFLTSADRGEIEALRNFKKIMLDFKKDLTKKKPVSLGVFGPPGAGKSFGVQQIALETFGKTCWLKYNLSQFSTGNLAELYGAFHEIRDKILSGLIPVVFFDEFDSKNYEWLQYLLAPMQDGEFQEGQLTHSIGRCIFIFAGATSHSFESFGVFKDSQQKEEHERNFILKKGPDFKSRIDAFYNVLGPNKKIKSPSSKEDDTSDTTFQLRRALFISSKIKYKNDLFLPIEVDPGLVHALLCISSYKHGARSLDKLLSLIISKDGTTLRRSNLPSNSQLELYVDAEEFNLLLNQHSNVLSEVPLQELAAVIYTSFLNFDEQTRIIATKDFGATYESLTADSKSDNIAAARRIQEILDVVNLKIEKTNMDNLMSDEEKRRVQEHINSHIELLAMLEHNGWWMHRISQGWKYADIPERLVKEKLHPLMKTYSDLPNYEKEKDRYSIRNYSKQLEKFGFQINWRV